MARLKFGEISNGRPNSRLNLSGDELWVGVKGYSNLMIAGFPRNRFKFSVYQKTNGVEPLRGFAQ